MTKCKLKLLEKIFCRDILSRQNRHRAVLLAKFFYRRFKFMSCTRKLVGILLACFIMCAAFFGWMLGQNKVSASADESESFRMEIPIEVYVEDGDRSGSLYITLTIGGTGNGYVWAKVTNVATIVPSTLWVYVELYSSTTYQESYTTMTLEYRESTRDLNQGESIGISASTNGQSRYWQARGRYKFQTDEWVAMTTSTFHCDANGNQIY